MGCLEYVGLCRQTNEVNNTGQMRGGCVVSERSPQCERRMYSLFLSFFQRNWNHEHFTFTKDPSKFLRLCRPEYKIVLGHIYYQNKNIFCTSFNKAFLSISQRTYMRIILYLGHTQFLEHKVPLIILPFFFSLDVFTFYRAAWCSGNVLDFYSEGAQTGHWLTW
jgi:hypothetical protein